MMKRLFIGIPVVSEKAVGQVQAWRTEPELEGTVLKWTKPENWHLTLIFLGNTPESLIDQLQNLIVESFAEVSAFQTRISGIGVFPNTHNPKVLWLGVENIQPLMPGYNRLTELLRQNDFSSDNKPLKPHLTLARIRNSYHNNSIESMIEKYQNADFGSVIIQRVVLFESILTPEGPVYKPLFVKKLK